MVSVLMPVYNAQLYLREAVESVLNQTYTDFEFIIINDGSTDDSERIILSYTDSRIKYIKNETNLKLIATLNKGIQLAKGDFIARMDADDICEIERLEKQVSFLNNNNDYVAVGSCYEKIDLLGEKIENVKLPLESEEVFYSLHFFNPICHPSVLIRNSVLIEYNLNFDENYVHAEDYEFWTRLLKYGKIGNLPDILLKYRVHETQVSNVYNEEQFLIDKKVKQNLFLKYFNIKVEDSILNLFDKKELAEEDSLSLSKFYLQLIDRNNLLKLFDKEWFIGKFRKSIRNSILSLKTISLSYFFKLLKSKVFFNDIFTLRQRIFVISKIRI